MLHSARVAHREACWAHNPEVGGSKPLSAMNAWFCEMLMFPMQAVFHLDTSLQESYLKHNISIYNISVNKFAKIAASLAQ